MKFYIRYYNNYLRHDFYKNQRYWTDDIKEAGQFTELEAALIIKRFFRDVKVNIIPNNEAAKLFNLD